MTKADGGGDGGDVENDGAAIVANELPLPRSIFDDVAVEPRYAVEYSLSFRSVSLVAYIAQRQRPTVNIVEENNIRL